MGVKHFEDMKLLKSSELDEKPCSSPDIKDGFVDSVDGIDDKNNESDIEDICSKNETVLYERKNFNIGGHLQRNQIKSHRRKYENKF